VSCYGSPFSKKTEDAMENWLQVVGFEGLYEVSDLGRVRSVPRLDVNKVPRGGIFMKLRECPVHHYITVKLTKNGKSKLCKVHRLVLEAFRRPSKVGEISLHGDDVKSNNSLTNLRWGTSKENKKDAALNGRIARGENNGGGGKLTENKVRQIRALISKGIKPTKIAERMNVSACTICDIKSGRSWTHVI
jgi:hypothetical protein